MRRLASSFSNTKTCGRAPPGTHSTQADLSMKVGLFVLFAPEMPTDTPHRIGLPVMKFVAFLPLGVVQPISDRIAKSEEEAAVLLKERASFIMSDEATRAIWSKPVRPALILKVTRSAPNSKSVNLRFSSCFLETKKTHFWQLRFELRLTPKGQTTFLIGKVKASGNAHTLNEQVRKQHAAVLAECICTIVSHPSGFDGLIPDGFGQTQPSCKQIAAEMHSMAAEQLALLDASHRAANESRRGILDLYDSIPDGTPLQVRNAIHPTYWQLEIKDGPLPSSSYGKVRIASPELLLGSDLRDAGVSNHVTLPLSIAAQSALEVAPAAAEFAQKPFRAGILHPTLPMKHKVGSTAKRGAPRKQSRAEIWIQTSFPRSTLHGRLSNGSQFYPGRHKLGFDPNFNFQGKVNPPILEMHEQSNAYQDVGAFPDIMVVAGLNVVSQKTKDVLDDHIMGDNQFHPFKIFRLDGSTLPGTWYHLVVGNHVRSVITSRCDPALIKWISTRAVQPREIVADGDAHGDLDLWSDIGVNPKPLVFSSRLRTALTKAGIPLRFGLKACATS